MFDFSGWTWNVLAAVSFSSLAMGTEAHPDMTLKAAMKIPNTNSFFLYMCYLH